MPDTGNRLLITGCLSHVSLCLTLSSTAAFCICLGSVCFSCQHGPPPSNRSSVIAAKSPGFTVVSPHFPIRRPLHQFQNRRNRKPRAYYRDRQMQQQGEQASSSPEETRAAGGLEYIVSHIYLSLPARGKRMA